MGVGGQVADLYQFADPSAHYISVEEIPPVPILSAVQELSGFKEIPSVDGERSDPMQASGQSVLRSFSFGDPEDGFGRDVQRQTIETLTDSVGPVAEKPPTQLNPISGTEGNDIIFATLGNFPNDWNHIIRGLGGNDLIVRDRTGDLASGSEVAIVGGNGLTDTGFDVVSYVGLGSGINGNLETGVIRQVVNGWPLLADNVDGIEGISATNHDDTLTGDSEDNEFWAGNGDDLIAGQAGNDTVSGGNGSDTIDGGADDDELHGDADADVISGGSGNDTIFGGEGGDEIEGNSGADEIHGGDGGDEIFSGSGNDTVFGGSGSDDIVTSIGNDTIVVGEGHDTVDAGMDDDKVHISGFGDNDLAGGSGTDQLFIAGNSSVLVSLLDGVAYRSDGTDTFTGFEDVSTAGGNDIIIGDNGANRLFGHNGGDSILGMAGDDSIYGGAGNDMAAGNDGDDLLSGASGDDTLNGGEGDDTINGGDGEDRITSGNGSDIVTGGTGEDVFVWNSGETSGIDHLVDFDINEDKFSFGEGFFDGGPGPIVLSDVLFATSNDGWTRLWADTAEDGLEILAEFNTATAEEVSARIANGTILKVETELDGPDGLELNQLEQFQPEFNGGYDFIV